MINKMKMTRFHMFAAFICTFLSAFLLFACIAAYPVSAEGASAEVFLSLSRTTLNIGKTFNMTLKVNPNANLDITSFDATLQYDSSKFDLTMDGAMPKITKPSIVPSGYEMSASLTGNKITIFGIDNSQAAPIKARGETSLIAFTFKVRDNAAIGTASFLINDVVLNHLVNSQVAAIPVTVKSTKTAAVAARLETNAYLSEITADVGTLTPAFSKTTTRYTIEVPLDCTSITINAKKASSNAKYSITGGSSLDYGSNKFIITVTAQDPDVVKVYTVTVNRPSPTPTLTEAVPTPTAEMTPSPTPEPTETVSNVPSSPDPTKSPDPDQSSLRFWRSTAYIFMGLFILTLLILLGFIINKAGEHKKVVKIRRR